MSQSKPPSSQSATAKANPPVSKLVVRHHVLAAIQQWQGQKHSLSDREKLVQSLKDLNQAKTVQDVLLQELLRCQDVVQQQELSDLLASVGDLQYLKSPLWELISQADLNDHQKDSLNQVLRQLGDTESPAAYLDYLDDPNALISQETLRMLVLAEESPQARVDLLDFLVALDESNQQELIENLCQDYDPQLLVKLFLPLLAYQPNANVSALVIDALGKSKSPKAKHALEELLGWPEDKRTHINTRQLGNTVKKLQLSIGAAATTTPITSIPLLKNSQLDKAYLSVPDGLGNQLVIMTRKQKDGKDMAALFIALNDTYGVLDCFGFEAISKFELLRLIERCHHQLPKAEVCPEFAAFKIKEAIELLQQRFARQPYELGCWLELIEDIEPTAQALLDIDGYIQFWADSAGQGDCKLLFEHPAFKHWFLDASDYDILSPLQKQLKALPKRLAEGIDASMGWLETLCQDSILNPLQEAGLPLLLTDRLLECVYLFHQQELNTFRNLAAKACSELLQNNPQQNSFWRAYGRYTLLQQLIKQQHVLSRQHLASLNTLIQVCQDTWGFTPAE